MLFLDIRECHLRRDRYGTIGGNFVKGFSKDGAVVAGVCKCQAGIVLGILGPFGALEGMYNGPYARYLIGPLQVMGLVGAVFPSDGIELNILNSTQDGFVAGIDFVKLLQSIVEMSDSDIFYSNFFFDPVTKN